MVEHLSGYMAIICNRWINEVEGTRCDLTQGHEGPCRTNREGEG
jgi:hypothetical protein